ncbi:MAG: MoaD/ThiS family protein, partial [Proteobacteria bacterium]|nr:MoaD/ThiS family protein [Pseudomonadota bacterium]MBU1740622.1 MoaD/ThiS family protein [Pseudomonadota bacterium]
MKIQVKLYFNFNKYSPTGEESFEMDLQEGSTVGQTLNSLSLPLEAKKVMLINGRPAHPESILKPGDLLVIFPPV